MLNLTDFKRDWFELAEEVDSYFITYWEERFEFLLEGTSEYKDSIKYSTLAGGKRFRPILALYAGEALGVEKKKILAYAAAVEMIHSFSLIHDDLPCMDDDDYRRGKLSNHKKFGEAIALLAGDGLVFEAVEIIKNHYFEEPKIALELIGSLMEASGSMGMIAGQVIDLHAQKEKLEIAEIEQVHLHKTGALIRAAVDGPAILAGATGIQRESLREYGEQLGLAFQVKDDLLEVEEGKVEKGSYPGIIGVVAANRVLTEVSDNALRNLEHFDSSADRLRAMVEFNRKRDK
ncbi:MAG: polyprenyl synthetase family protein [Bdellovibrionales bacterium]